MVSTAPESVPGGAQVQVLAGRYELGEPIGRGGSAVVHRAWDQHAARPVAVKLFTPGVDSRGGPRRERELRVLSGLQHPGLVAVYDVGEDEVAGCERSFLVMELVEGTILDACRAQGPMTPERVAELGHELASTLAYVHSHGITHRDVKPANVLLDSAGHAHLTDFGIALLLDLTRLTATDSVIGTAAYMAPEQLCGEPVGPATDIYALGLVLLEALTGQPAFPGRGREAVLARLTRQPAVPADAPRPLARTLIAMTADQPSARPTAAKVASALGTAAPTTPLPIPAPRASAPTTESAAVATDASVAAVAADAPPPTPTRRASIATAARAHPARAVAALLVTAVFLVATGTAVAATWWLPGGSAPTPGGGPAQSAIAAPPTSSAPPVVGIVPEAPSRSTAAGTSRVPTTGLSAARRVTAEASAPRRAPAGTGGSDRTPAATSAETRHAVSDRSPAATSAETRTAVAGDDKKDKNDPRKENKKQGDKKQGDKNGAEQKRGD